MERENSGTGQLHSSATRTLKQKKKNKGQNHNIKRMRFIEMLHTEMSVVQPAAAVQMSLEFRRQMVGYHLFKYRGGLQTSKENRKVAINWSHKAAPQRAGQLPSTKTRSWKC